MNALDKSRKMGLNAFKRAIFLSPPEGTGRTVQILTPKQMLRRWPLAITQVQAANTSEKLLNEICQNIISLYRVKEIVRKIYNNTINSIEM